MSEEKILAILCAAERLGLIALTWMPYSDEMPNGPTDEWRRDEIALRRDLEFVRHELDKQKEAVLNIAITRGRKP